jgi:squalene cyclase
MNNREAYNKYLTLREQLLAEMNQEGFWTGWLATSALSTAVAIVALKAANDAADQEKIAAGFYWLCQNINNDGGFGDTTGSISNVSTTLLCYAAISYCQTNDKGSHVLTTMEKWLAAQGIIFNSDAITSSILKFYDKDYTFSVPILSMLTLCGVLPVSSLEKIPGLPFELALLPASWYHAFNLHVVSYALPALIGVGIYLHKHRKKGILRKGLVRNQFIKPALEKLNKLVPHSGGFLEAIPLTGFVAMCLITSGMAENKTVVKGLEFLRIQQREDGGWPIDTDLSTWVTTLSIKALGTQLKQVLNENQLDLLRNHLLKLQFKTSHPFNGAKPGGWGWTSYSGSVPDADDTPGALLALLEMYAGGKEELTAIENGCKWLIDLQNKDGGFPTFCKGWGKLPFDRSCADLTGHALLAFLKIAEKLHQHISPQLMQKIDRGFHMAMGYLTKQQLVSGAWLPLWFGNQLTNGKTNPVYGTAKVCIYLGDCLTIQYPENEFIKHLSRLADKARNYLLLQQNDDGSWGGEKGTTGTIEETSLAICALAADHEEASARGLDWLFKQKKITAAPIGLYFALLWYDEKLYPLIYYTEALRRFLGY